MSSSEQFVGAMGLIFLVFVICAVFLVGLFVYCVVRLVWGVVCWIRKRRTTYVVVR